MLAEVPSEILSHIAYHLCSSDLSPPVNLLQTCRTIYESICPRSNPRLYSKLFKEAFDIGAVERRLEGDELHALHISLELERRVKCLNRLKKMITRGNVIDVTMDDLWVIYIMLIENDGKNIQHFTDGSIDLYTFLRLYHEQCLLVVAVQPGYPKETPERGLIMWIAWLLSGYESTRKIHPESIEERQERLFILRPYVFAPHEYELCFAPWTISHLPIHEAATRRNEHHPFGADLTPKIKTVTVGYYGKVLDISGPLLSHAAILRFFVQRPENGSISDDEILSPFQALLGRRMGRNVGISNQLGTPMRESDDGSDVDSDDGDETFGAIRDLISDSKNHDRDFKRLLSCHDPFRCAGMKRSAWRGSFQGCWEGNFSFFDLEAFRDMLNGNSRALYEGSFGEQAQVWRIIETWVWTSDYGSRKRRQRQKELEEREKKRKEREALGEVVSDDEVMVDKGKGRAKGLPLTGPATNAGFPTNLPSSTLAGLATPAAEAITLNETIKQQVEAVKGYEIVPESEMEEVLSSPDGGEAAGLEMILTGVGHSAWGRFILKGKVRAWDGMASLVKEYAVSSDSRGKWIYRGYVVSGDIFVGRWRDTFTPEEYIGYEGTFVLHRR